MLTMVQLSKSVIEGRPFSSKLGGSRTVAIPRDNIIPGIVSGVFPENVSAFLVGRAGIRGAASPSTLPRPSPEGPGREGPRRVPFRVLHPLATCSGRSIEGLIFALARNGADPSQVPGDSTHRSATLSASG